MPFNHGLIQYCDRLSILESPDPLDAHLTTKTGLLEPTERCAIVQSGSAMIIDPDVPRYYELGDLLSLLGIR